MQNKRIILIVVLGLAAVIVAVLAFVLFSKNNQQSAQQTPSGTNTGTTGTTSGTGGVGVVQQNKSTFSPHVDLTQPFATTLPRVDSPPAQPVTQSDQQTINQKVANGEIADANGMYVQKVSNTGMTDSQQQTYNNYKNLDDNTFLAQNYPDAQNVVDNTTPQSVATSNQDPIIYQNNVQSTTPSTIPLVPGIDPKLFKTTSGNDQAALDKYFNAVAGVLQILNIQDPKLVSDVLQNLDQNTIFQYQQLDQQALAQLQTITVPNSMLGLQQSYYQAYQDYSQLLSDSIRAINAASNSTQAADLTGVLQTDTSNFTDALSNLSTNIDTASAIVNANSSAADQVVLQLQK